MVLLWAVGAMAFVSFLAIVFRGAPFVPTRRDDVASIFSAYSFKPRERFIDLGSGDGRLLAAAAERGILATGYELNPFLVLFSRWHLRNYRPKPAVQFADFWLSKLPDDTGVVFVFLAGPFMAKLDDKLQAETDRLGRSLTLISYGVKLPHKTAEERGGCLLYRYHPHKENESELA